MLSRNAFLYNRYRIIRSLGKGGFGQVYEALDDKLDCIVAIKERLADLNSEKMRRAFEREAKLLANLRHPVLPKVTDHFFAGEGQYLVMEFIEGDDLAKLLSKRQQPFRVEQVLTWADDILKALNYLHTRPEVILHRDIKPANIKLTSEGEIFLLDFGLAKGYAGEMSIPEVSQRSSSVHGYTAAYAPLEQLTRSGTNEQSDIYSLGATLYHLLTGRVPITAAQRYKNVELGERDPLVPVHEVNPAVPLSVSLVVSESMAMSRRDRLRSASQMRQAFIDARRAIEAAQTGTQTESPEPAPREGDVQESDALVPTAPSPTIASPTSPSPLLNMGVSNGQHVYRVPPVIGQPPSQGPPTAEPSQPSQEISWPSQLNSQAGDSSFAPTIVESELEDEEVSTELRTKELERRRLEEEELERQRLEEVARKEAEEKRLRAVEEARRIAEEEARRQAEAEARRAEEERLRAEEEERRRREEEQARLKAAAEEARRQREQEQRLAAEAEAKRRAEEEARREAEAEAARRRAEEEAAARLREEQEATRRAAEEARKRAEEEARHRAEEEERRRAEVERRRRAEEEAKRSTEEAQRREAESRQRAAKEIFQGEEKHQKRGTSLARIVIPIGAVVLLVVIAYAAFWRTKPGSETPGLPPPTLSQSPTANSEAPTSSAIEPLGEIKTGSKIFDVALNSDGRLLVSTGAENMIRLWEVSKRSPLPALTGYDQPGRCLAISPDGQIVASGNDDGSIRLWNVSTASPIKTISAHTKYVFFIRFSKDGQTLTSAGADKKIRQWQVNDGKLLVDMALPSPDYLIVTINPDQRIAALYKSSDKRVHLLSVGDKTELRELDNRKEKISSGAFSPDGQHLALGTADGAVQVWDVNSGRLTGTLKASKTEVSSMAFSPDGRLLAVGWMDGAIRLVRVGEKDWLKSLEDHAATVNSLAFSGDGRTLASGSNDQTIRLWKISR